LPSDFAGESPEGGDSLVAALPPACESSLPASEHPAARSESHPTTIGIQARRIAAFSHPWVVEFGFRNFYAIPMPSLCECRPATRPADIRPILAPPPATRNRGRFRVNDALEHAHRRKRSSEWRSLAIPRNLVKVSLTTTRSPFAEHASPREARFYAG
jgi:hypothetical protein